MSDAPQVTHFADDATLARMAQLERDLAAAQEQIAALKAERDSVIEDSKSGLSCALKEIAALKAELQSAYDKIREHGLELLKAGDSIRAALERK